MSKSFRLYVGLVRGGVWYNYTELGDLKGAALALDDSRDATGIGRYKNLLKHLIKELLTEGGGERYELQDHDYDDIKFADSMKIGLMAAHHFSVDSAFDEFFPCPACSSGLRMSNTKRRESWLKLIADADIDEHYLETEDCSWQTDLPCGIIIEDAGSNNDGTYKRVRREPVTIGEIVKISHNENMNKTEGMLECAKWDAEIKEIEGLDPTALKRLKRNPAQSFSKKHIEEVADVDEMRSSYPKIGIDAEFRKVTCETCNNEIGGYLDHTNFFSLFQGKKAARN